MKILFIAKGQESLTIETLSAVLKCSGHEVELLFDPGFDDLLGFINLSFLKLNDDQWYIDRIRSYNPDLICFSALTNLYNFVTEKAALIKKHFSVPIAVGGIHPTILPDYVLQNPDIDMICIGEGDEAIVELTDKMQHGLDYADTRNFWFKRNGNIIRNDIRPLIQELDEIPFPDRDIFYQYGTFAGTLYIATGRGCPFTCTYCCHHFLQKMYSGKGKYTRRRSVENVIAEIEQCIAKYNVKTIYSMDDLFTLDEQWIEEFADAYGKRIAMPLYCHVRPGTVTQRMVNSLKKAHCNSVFYGTDSGNEQMRYQIMNRRMTNQAIIDSAKVLKNNNIKITTSAIFCLPEETREQMLDTVNLIKQIKSDYAYTYMYYPFPKTESYEYCVEKGLLDKDTITRIYQGYGSFHKGSLLQKGEFAFAQILKTTLPVTIRFPWLEKPVAFIMRYELVFLSKLLFFLTAPITYAQFGRNKIMEFISVAKAHMKKRITK